MVDTIVSWFGGQANTAAFAILTGVIGFLAKGVYDLWMARRKDKLERVNRQLRLLYGPLFSLVNMSSNTWAAFVDQCCESPDFQTEGRIRPRTPETEEVWRHWIQNVFMPLNLQMVKLIMENADLLEGERMPECLIKLSAHVHGYKAILAAWERGDHSRHMSLTPFPKELYSYAVETYRVLKNRQARLLGRS